MVVPKIKWLGITADDILEFQLQGTFFSESEKKRFASIKQRDYIKKNTQLLEQIARLEQLGIKVEIEALSDYSADFLLDIYLPYKLQYKKWI